MKSFLRASINGTYIYANILIRCVILYGMQLPQLHVGNVIINLELCGALTAYAQQWQALHAKLLCSTCTKEHKSIAQKFISHAANAAHFIAVFKSAGPS